ncbi:MAG: ABC transporter permease [Paludibacteraceae bacterium]|nr:ABC transporter permease [Paludibacteraceae bacterium]
MVSLTRQIEIVLRVAKREVNMLLRRPVYIFSTIFVMFFSCVFFLTLFKTGSPEKMPIAVVDLDHSAISRRVVHELNATQAVDIVAVTDTYEQGRRLMQQGRVYAFVVIPERFYADLASFKRPEVVFYMNNAYTIGASTASKQLLTVMTLASGAFQREVLRKKGLPEYLIMKRLQPIAVESHFIGNPSSNYLVYLTGIILPGILGLIVLMITIYSIGLELKGKTSRDWLRAAQGSFTRAMVGKLLPHEVLYCAMGVTMNIVLVRMMHFPVNGSFVWLNVGMVAYILAMQSIAVTFVGIIPILRVALSAGALYGMLSFSLSGFTFPKMGMLPFVQALTNLFPLRHYYLIYVNEVLLGNPITQSLPAVAVLIAFTGLQMLIMRRLHKALLYQYFPKD